MDHPRFTTELGEFVHYFYMVLLSLRRMQYEYVCTILYFIVKSSFVKIRDQLNLSRHCFVFSCIIINMHMPLQYSIPI